MSLQMFLSIIIPVVLAIGSLIVMLFVNNNNSHKEIWKQINSNNLEITNRLIRIETKLEDMCNGRKK